MIAYSSGNDLKIDRLRSEYIVSSIKKEIVDIRDLALQLKDAVDLYEKQLTKISHDGYEELPIHCFNLKDANGGLTNYNTLSGNTHSKEQLNHYANQHNPNNSAYQANRDNRSNQCNPNNKEYDHSRGSGQKR